MKALTLRLQVRVALVAAAITVLMAPAAYAQITKIVIDRARSESPAFEGRAFGTHGSVGRTASSILAIRETRSSPISPVRLAMPEAGSNTRWTSSS
jgi:hypothetical protein